MPEDCDGKKTEPTTLLLVSHSRRRVFVQPGLATLTVPSAMKSLGAYGAAPPPQQPQKQQQQQTLPTARAAASAPDPAPGVAMAVPQALTPEATHAELEKRLPQEPPQSECDPETLRKVAGAVAAGQSVVGRLKQHTAFRNPEIMAQLVNFVAIDEKGSNYAPHVFDSSCRGMKDHVALAEEQNAFLERLQTQQAAAAAAAQPMPSVAARRAMEVSDTGGPAAKKQKDAVRK